MHHTDGNRDSDNASEGINIDEKPFTSVNEEDKIETMQEVDDIIDIFPEEANDEDLRRSKIRPKRHDTGTDIDRLVLSFDGNTYKSEGGSS